MTSQMEERLREALGDKAFKALRWYISRAIEMDMVEALEKDPEKARKALEEFFKSRYPAEILMKVAGIDVGLQHHLEEDGRE